MRLTTGRAAALGALHGPAELLPISSSGHVTLVPWLLGWQLDEQLGPDLRKSFEVALHVGTLAGLLVSGGCRPRHLRVMALASLPPAAAGYALEDPVQRRLGTPSTVAAGLLAGSVAMALAERTPQRRRAGQARGRDALLIGLGQAIALFPGVSRQAASMAAARALRFTRADAELLSRQAGLPVLAGAGALKAVRLAQRGLPTEMRRPFAAGMLTSLASTAACARWLTRRPGRSPAPWIVYRTALALVTAARCKTMPNR